MTDWPVRGADSYGDLAGWIDAEGGYMEFFMDQVDGAEITDHELRERANAFRTASDALYRYLEEKGGLL